MNTILNTDVAKTYKSKSQIARVVTENWVQENMFCPHCGNEKIIHFENNRPVADFYCEKCKNEYELKSKNGSLATKINDGAYSKMIERIFSDTNPDFFLMNYSLFEKTVIDFVILPKNFFTSSIIEKRKPLSQSAKRAGWVGCNILLKDIPKQGRIVVVQNKKIVDKRIILRQMGTSQHIQVQNIESRGWLLDVLSCINQLGNDFILDDVYKFEGILCKKHPNNHNVLPKIRQQLQFLRDKGLIEFLGNGRYRKTLDLLE